MRDPNEFRVCRISASEIHRGRRSAARKNEPVIKMGSGLDNGLFCERRWSRPSSEVRKEEVLSEGLRRFAMRSRSIGLAHVRSLEAKGTKVIDRAMFSNGLSMFL